VSFNLDPWNQNILRETPYDINSILGFSNIIQDKVVINQVIATIVVVTNSFGIIIFDTIDMELNGRRLALADPESSSCAITRISNNNAPQDRTRVIEHSMGETEITGSPEKIVSLYSTATEQLLTLGVQPIGVTKGGLDHNLDHLDANLTLSRVIVDVGTEQEPNLEVIAQLQPDLIVGGDRFHDYIYDELSSIAPTVLYPMGVPPSSVIDPITHIEQVEQSFLSLAKAVNQTEKGSEIVQDFNSTLFNARLQIEGLGLTGQKFLLAETGLENEIPIIYLYQNNNAEAQVLTSIGLKNALTTTSEPWGTEAVGLVALSALDGSDVHFFFRDLDARSVLLNNSSWQNLEFVKNDQVYRLGEGYYFPGTIRGLQSMIDQALDALVSKSSKDTR
jgi:ferric hydroxamate transport system substrate-binding protein